MVEEDAAEDAEARHVVFVGIIRPIPRYNIKGCVVLCSAVKFLVEAGEDGPILTLVRGFRDPLLDIALEECGRDLEVSWVG